MTATKQALFTGLLSLLLLGAVVFSYASLTRNTEPVTAPQATVTQVNPPSVDELLTLVNAEREKVGVAPLVIDERLNKSAQQKADDMNVNNYFAHKDLNGRQGYDIAHEYAPDICMNPSENLRMNGDTNSSKAAIEGWKTSKAHFEAMLKSKYTYTGFGISGNYIAQHFC